MQYGFSGVLSLTITITKTVVYENKTLTLTITVTVTKALVLRPPYRRPRAHHRVNPYPGGRRQNGREMYSDHDETINDNYKCNYGKITANNYN